MMCFAAPRVLTLLLPPTSSRFLAPSTSSTSTLLAFSWIIDSEDSSQMTRTSSLLSSYHPTPSCLPVTIGDGQPSPVQGHENTCVTPSLSLHQILYVPSFPVNLPSISAITHTLSCIVIFFPFHYFFQDLYT